MDLEKLKPWNWFQHEDESTPANPQIPVKRSEDAALNDPFLGMQRDMDRLLERFSSALGMPSLATDLGRAGRPAARLMDVQRPSIDVSGDDECYEVQLDVPGMSEDDLSIDIKDSRLVIRGEKRERAESKEKHYYRVERRYGTFQRTLSLPDDANVEAISAQLKDGVLRLEIPRRSLPDSDVRRIAISS